MSEAQRRQRGEPDANWNEIDRFARSTAPLTVRDVESLSAVKVLADQRKKLKLSDEQNTALKTLLAKEKEETAGFLQAVDSLRKLARARPTAMTEEEQTRMSIARADLRSVIDSVSARYRSSLSEAMPVFDETQRAEATPILEKHRQESATMLRAKFAEMSQAAGRPAAGAGGRRRP
jgi:dsDNA-binding SOS-regulon protein